MFRKNSLTLRFVFIISTSLLIFFSDSESQVTNRRIFRKTFQAATVDTIYLWLPVGKSAAGYDTSSVGTPSNIPVEVFDSGNNCVGIKRVGGGSSDSVRIKVKPVICQGIVSNGDSLWALGTASSYSNLLSSLGRISLISFNGTFDPVSGYMIEVTVGDAILSPRLEFEWRTNVVK